MAPSRRTTADPPPAVDIATFAVALVGRLRASGVGVDLTSATSLTRGLAVAAPRRRDELYWLTRITVLRRHGDLETFDRVFGQVFGLGPDPAGPVPRVSSPAPAAPGAHHTPVPRATHEGSERGALPWVTRPSIVADDEDGTERARRPPLSMPLPSRLAAAGDTPLPDLDADQLAELGRWLESARRRWPVRRGRRPVPTTAGRRISLRHTMMAARRTAFEPVTIVRSRPSVRPRRVVLICDLSQSMQPYAAAYLHLMRAAAVAGDAEVFAFATRLTRLTSALTDRSVGAAMARATGRVVDRFGGTRIAGSLRELLHSHHGEALRGAIVVIASDGWDSDEPDDLDRVMARIRRRAHRVVWVNPRVAAPGYEPLTGGMAAAWPHCDVVLPGLTVEGLREVIGAIVEAGDRRLSSRA